MPPVAVELPGVKAAGLLFVAAVAQVSIFSQLHVFGRCGHWTQIEHAQEFNRLVRSFISDN